MDDPPPRTRAHNTRSGSKPHNTGPEEAKASSLFEVLKGLLSRGHDIRAYPWPLLISGAIFLVFFSMFLAVLVLLCAMSQSWAPISDMTTGGGGGGGKPVWGWMHWGIVVVQVAAAGVQLWWLWQWGGWVRGGEGMDGCAEGVMWCTRTLKSIWKGEYPWMHSGRVSVSYRARLKSVTGYTAVRTIPPFHSGLLQRQLWTHQRPCRWVLRRIDYWVRKILLRKDLLHFMDNRPVHIGSIDMECSHVCYKRSEWFLFLTLKEACILHEPCFVLQGRQWIKHRITLQNGWELRTHATLVQPV